jgi:hypothetical protein
MKTITSSATCNGTALLLWRPLKLKKGTKIDDKKITIAAVTCLPLRARRRTQKQEKHGRASVHDVPLEF